MLTREIIDTVNAVRLGFIATVNDDGTPNLSPKGTLLVLDPENLFFINIASPHTARNLAARPAAEVNVVDFYRRKGYRFRCEGMVVEPGLLFDRVVETTKAMGLDPGRYVFKEVVVLKVLKVSPVFSPAYDLGRSEADLRAQYRSYYGEHL